MEKETAEMFERLITSINEVNEHQDQRVTDLANLMLKFVTEVRKNAEQEIVRTQVMQKLFSDYADRLSVSSNRPRSEIIEELNLEFEKSFPQTNLRIV